MTKDTPREGSALAVLREMLAILDRHPNVRQYVRTAGLLEPALPFLERRARRLVADADAVDAKPSKPGGCIDCGAPTAHTGHMECQYPGRVSDARARS